MTATSLSALLAASCQEPLWVSDSLEPKELMKKKEKKEVASIDLEPSGRMAIDAACHFLSLFFFAGKPLLAMASMMQRRR